MERCNCDFGELRDYGGEPTVLNIQRLAVKNRSFRIALWTGKYLQTTLMSIPTGGEIGAELHHDTDQFIRIVQGRGAVFFGKTRDSLKEVKRVDGNYGVFVPAGTWHNIKNIGNTPLKLYSVYAPPHHTFGTVEKYG